VSSDQVRPAPLGKKIIALMVSGGALLVTIVVMIVILATSAGSAPGTAPSLEPEPFTSPTNGPSAPLAQPTISPTPGLAGEEESPAQPPPPAPAPHGSATITVSPSTVTCPDGYSTETIPLTVTWSTVGAVGRVTLDGDAEWDGMPYWTSMAPSGSSDSEFKCYPPSSPMYTGGDERVDMVVRVAFTDAYGTLITADARVTNTSAGD
jgi:hypothetical protein